MRRKRNRRIKIKSVHTPLRLTSMMDILTVLLLFLLKSFVVDGEVNKDAAWYYPEIKPAAKNIEGYVAFWRGVTMED